MGGLKNFRIRKPSGTPKGGTSGWAHSAQAATLCRIDTSHEAWFGVGGPEGHKKVRHSVAVRVRQYAQCNFKLIVYINT